MNDITCTFPVRNMICHQCEDAIRYYLKDVPGVLKVEPDYRTSTVTLEADADLCTKETIDRTLADAGYPVGKSVLTGLRADVLTAVLSVVLALLLRRLPGMQMPQNTLRFVSLLVFGFVGGVHCIAMCGGILLAVTGARTLKEERTLPLGRALSYNAGRVAGGVLIGAVLGGLGSMAVLSGQVRSLLHAIAGAAVILVGLLMWGIVPGLRSIFTRKRSPRRKRHRLHPSSSVPPITGFANAFLPCGLSFAVYSCAASAGSAGRGALVTLAFGLGTCVFMMLPGLLSLLIPAKARPYLIRINVILVLALGMSMFGEAVGSL